MWRLTNTTPVQWWMSDQILFLFKILSFIFKVYPYRKNYHRPLDQNIVLRKCENFQTVSKFFLPIKCQSVYGIDFITIKSVDCLYFVKALSPICKNNLSHLFYVFPWLISSPKPYLVQIQPFTALTPAMQKHFMENFHF